MRSHERFSITSPLRLMAAAKRLRPSRSPVPPSDVIHAPSACRRCLMPASCFLMRNTPPGAPPARDEAVADVISPQKSAAPRGQARSAPHVACQIFRLTRVAMTFNPRRRQRHDERFSSSSPEISLTDYRLPLPLTPSPSDALSMPRVCRFHVDSFSTAPSPRRERVVHRFFDKPRVRAPEFSARRRVAIDAR